MLIVKNISFAYTKTKVLEDVSFVLKKGEHLSVIGESGSGKSTLLKLLYGEHDLDRGHIYWNNHEVLGPKHNLVVGYDAIKYVSQEFDLMPFTSVEENVGKFLSNFFPEEKKERVNELLAVVELASFRNSKVKSLSGGQKQRVALARAIAKQPELILLDEPFSHIDNFKKQLLRRSLFRYLKNNDITSVVATHDKNDVLGYADRMIVLNNHIIEANDSPENLYKNPKSPLIASFFNEFNVINNKILYANELMVVETSRMRATVKQSYFKGSYYLIEADLDGQTLFIEHSDFLDATTPIFIELKNPL
jgi:ABC-type sulfate/molybdate transport systems ATPase subunit